MQDVPVDDLDDFVVPPMNGFGARGGGGAGGGGRGRSERSNVSFEVGGGLGNA